MPGMVSMLSWAVLAGAFPTVCAAVLDANAAQSFCAPDADGGRRQVLVSTFGDGEKDFAPPTAAFGRDGAMLLAMSGRRLGDERFPEARVLAWALPEATIERVPQDSSCRGEACFEEALGVDLEGTRWTRLVFPAHTVFLAWPRGSTKRRVVFDDRKLQQGKPEPQAALFDVTTRQALVWNEGRRDFKVVDLSKPKPPARSLTFLAPGEQAFPLRFDGGALWFRIVSRGRAVLARVTADGKRNDVGVLGAGALEGVSDVFFVLEAAGAVFVRALSGASPSVVRIDLVTKEGAVVAPAASLQAVSADGRFVAFTTSPKPGTPEAPFHLTVLELGSNESRHLSLGALVVPDAVTVSLLPP
jgi:hypothetical protein